MNRTIARLTMFAALLVAGCDAIPVLQHPLSDETNSEIDPELIGLWDVIHVEKQEGLAAAEPAEAKSAPEEPAADNTNNREGDEERPPRFALGRLSGKERSMELVSLQLTDEHVDVKRVTFHVTKVGKQRLLSIRLNPEQAESDFVVLRYEIASENRILVRMLNRDVIAQAIQRGELKGIVRKAKPADPIDPNDEPRKELIRITASPQELRDYLTKQEKTAFDPQPVWRLQRAAVN